MDYDKVSRRLRSWMTDAGWTLDESPTVDHEGGLSVMGGWSARERGLWLRGSLASLSALSFMSVSWAGETASLVGTFALGMSLGSLYYLSRLEGGR